MSTTVRVEILKGLYKDSVELMQISKKCKQVAGIEDVVVMMGTEENKGILKSAGYLHDSIAHSLPNDCLLVVKGEEKATLLAIDDIKASLKNEKAKNTNETVSSFPLTSLLLYPSSLIFFSSVFSSIFSF